MAGEKFSYWLLLIFWKIFCISLLTLQWKGLILNGFFSMTSLKHRLIINILITTYTSWVPWNINIFSHFTHFSYHCLFLCQKLSNFPITSENTSRRSSLKWYTHRKYTYSVYLYVYNLPYLSMLCRLITINSLIDSLSLFNSLSSPPTFTIMMTICPSKESELT